MFWFSLSSKTVFFYSISIKGASLLESISFLFSLSIIYLLTIKVFFTIKEQYCFLQQFFFTGPEDGSWFTWKMHQFTLAKHTLAARTLHTYRVYTLLRTRTQTHIHTYTYLMSTCTPKPETMHD